VQRQTGNKKIFRNKGGRGKNIKKEIQKEAKKNETWNEPISRWVFGGGTELDRLKR
jgi:hypothetical protein